MDWLGSAEAYALYNYSNMVWNWAGYPFFSAWHSLKEEFVEECELIRFNMLENDLAIEGEFISEETVRDDWG